MDTVFKLDTIIRILSGVGGAIASYLWGGWSKALETLLVFVFVDYITGIIAAAIHGKLSSKVGFLGILSKVCMFLVVAVAHFVDQSLGDGHMFRDAAITFYLANEALSVIENIGQMGLPIPESIQKAVRVLREDHENRGGEKH